jgi:hypothetical protein
MATVVVVVVVVAAVAAEELDRRQVAAVAVAVGAESVVAQVAAIRHARPLPSCQR